MSFLERINQALEDFGQSVRLNSINSVFNNEPASISFTEPKSGFQIKVKAPFIRDESLAYLIFPEDDKHGKTLARGLPVNIQIGEDIYNGWGEHLTNNGEFIQALAKDPLRMEELKKRYNIHVDSSEINTTQMHDFFEENKLIRVKISR
jgi:hypothetical protein